MPVDVMAAEGAAAWLTAAGDVEGLAEAGLRILEREDAELSVLLTDDAHIRVLNRDYRDKDSPTDVLSFGQDEGEAFPGMVPVLGDLVISLETAERQAQERGHPVAAEVRVLLVHGLLHLMGHDHIEDDERAEMAAAEDALLAALPAMAEWPTTSGLIGRQGGP